MLEIFINGTSGTYPLPSRALCSIALRFNGKILLLDTGEGTQLSYLKSGWGFRDIGAIFLSHAHADHTSGLVGILLQIKNSGRNDPIFVFAPKEVEIIVKSSLTICACNLHFQVIFVPIDEGEIHLWNDLSLTFLTLEHHPTSYGIKISTNRKPLFDPEKAQSLQIPQYFWKRLHNGEIISFEGKVYHPEQVVSRQKTNLNFCYIPDTKFTALPSVKQFTKGSDLAILECMYPTKDELRNQSDKFHTSLPHILESSIESSVKKLGLIHFSPAYRNVKKDFPFDKEAHPNLFLCEDSQRIILNYVD